MKKSQKTLMVIDDEETDRALIREILQREGYDVAEADGYHSSLRLFAQIRDSVSLLIADVALGDGNGCDAALMMRNEKPDLRVLFTSFHVGSEVLRFYGLEVTDEHFLQKPFSASELSARVSKLLNSAAAFPAFCETPKPKARTAG